MVTGGLLVVVKVRLQKSGVTADKCCLLLQSMKLPVTSAFIAVRPDTG